MRYVTKTMQCLAGVVLLAMTASCVTIGQPVKKVEKKDPGLKEIGDRLHISEAMRLPAGAMAYQRHPGMAYGNGVYFIAWQEGFNGAGENSDILGLRIDENGTWLDREPIRICTQRAIQDAPTVAFCAGKFLVCWADLRNGVDYDVYATVVGLDGKVHTENGFPVSAGQGARANPAVTSNGEDTFFVVWQDYRSGKWFEIRSVRISARDGSLLDKDGVTVMPRGEVPAVTFTGKDYVVCQKWYAARVGIDGKPKTESTQVWQTKSILHPAVTAGWGIPFVFMNTNPSPDPWGWGGNGGIIGVTVGDEGSSPEKTEFLKKHSVRDLSWMKANGQLRNCLDAARWRNLPGWPMGRPGGFKGTRENSWPSGKTAAAFNGCSVVVAWTRARADRYYLKSRDIYLRRVGRDWAYFDRAKIRVAAGETDEANPVLCAGSIGYTMLAYERQLEEGGIIIEYRLVYEMDDTAPPRVDYIARESDTKMIIGFDEPVDPKSASVSTHYSITNEAVKIKTVRFNTDPRALQREVIVETEPMTPGHTYTLKTVGIKDRSDRANATSGEPYKFTAKPGGSQRSDFIERWSLVGPFPADRKATWVSPVTSDPSPGAVVDPGKDDDVKGSLKRAVGQSEWKEAEWKSTFGPAFTGKKTWTEVPTHQGTVLAISAKYKELAPAVAYANTYVYSDKGRDVLLRISSADGHTAWLNRKRVSDDKGKRALSDRTDEIPVELNKGWNQLMVRVENLFGRWQLVAQFTDMNGLPLRGLTYQLEKPVF